MYLEEKEKANVEIITQTFPTVNKPALLPMT